MIFLDSDLDKFLLERDEALRTLDLDWAKKNGALRASRDEVVLCSLHKARYETLSIEDALRQESRKWLEERGYSRMFKIPWPQEGKLPRKTEDA